MYADQQHRRGAHSSPGRCDPHGRRSNLCRMEFRCVGVYRSGANREKEDRQPGKRHNLRCRLRVRPGWCFRFWSAEQKAITGTAPDCSWLADSLLSSKGSGQRADNAPLPPGQQGSSSLRDRENCPTAKRDLGTVEHINSGGDL